MKIAVLDIETIPDAEVMARMSETLEGFKVKSGAKDPAKVAAQQAEWVLGLPKKCALDPFLGRVCCVGMYLQDEYGGEITGRTFHLDNGWNEGMVLEATWKELRDVELLVTYNGALFDMPYLSIRSAKYGIPVSVGTPFPNKYRTKGHVDLMQVLSAFGAMSWPSLDKACRFFDIEVKSGGEAADVWPWFKALEYKKIADYCMEDVGATLQLYNRLFDCGLIGSE